jgi:hypothetical protein
MQVDQAARHSQRFLANQALAGHRFGSWEMDIALDPMVMQLVMNSAGTAIVLHLISALVVRDEVAARALQGSIDLEQSTTDIAPSGLLECLVDQVVDDPWGLVGNAGQRIR